MEILIGQKPAKKGVTVTAAVLMLVIAVLQSVQMTDQKSRRWSALLDGEMLVDGQLSLMVPALWRSVPAEGTYVLRLEGELPSEPGQFLFSVVRRPIRDVSSLDEVLSDAVVGNRGFSVLALATLPCRFAGTPAMMSGYHWAGPGDQPVYLRVIIAEDQSGGLIVLTLRVVGGADEAARGLLRHIASAAKWKRRT